jgi:hypothetical protein
MAYVYFQTSKHKKPYCDVGMISETDKKYIWYLYEPCKVLISDVKIIDKENVYYDYKIKSHCVKEAEVVKRLRGRPKTGTVAYHRNIPPEIKEKLDKCLTTLKKEYYAKQNNTSI